MLHDLIRTWFGWVEHWGYLGVFVLMAMESSIIPVPSEIVMPPAAFWAAQGKLNFWGVVFAGTAGSYVGSIAGYALARAVGYPLLHKYGKYVLLPARKLAMAESWLSSYGVAGIFAARLLPVIRHLISYPAGAFRMPWKRFSLATLTGAGIWCWVLSEFGAQVLGSNPELLNSPETLVSTVRNKLGWFVVAVAVLAILYVFVTAYGGKGKRAQ